MEEYTELIFVAKINNRKKVRIVPDGAILKKKKFHTVFVTDMI